MARLMNQSKNLIVASELVEANSFWSRSKGLLGRTGLADHSSLWIRDCRSIHTCFMKFTIDAVFVDKNLVVRAAYPAIKPWRLTWPVFSARSVFEFSTGAIARGRIEKGDQLSVVD